MPQSIIPEHELTIDSARASGPGGQNVNKTETKIILRWNVRGSGVFTDEQKQKISAHLRSRMNTQGEVVIHSQRERSQYQNRQQALQLLRTLVARALRPRKKRIPTKPKRAAREERLAEKKAHQRAKASRRVVEQEG